MTEKKILLKIRSSTVTLIFQQEFVVQCIGDKKWPARFFSLDHNYLMRLFFNLCIGSTNTPVPFNLLFMTIGKQRTNNNPYPSLHFCDHTNEVPHTKRFTTTTTTTMTKIIIATIVITNNSQC